MSNMRFTKETYYLQSKMKLKNPAIGPLLDHVYKIEQILVTNDAQFNKFYRQFKREKAIAQGLPEELIPEIEPLVGNELIKAKVDTCQYLLRDLWTRCRKGEFYVKEQ